MQRRQWVQSGAWVLATCASVTVSWFGVHTVVAGTAYDPPRAMPVSGTPGAGGDPPRASSTHRPEPSRSPGPSAPDRDEKPDASPSGEAPTRSPGSTGAEPPGGASPDGGDDGPDGPGTGGGSRDASGEVRSASVTGGRAVFDVGEDAATLVSATPHGGWSMQVWKTETWIRVTFTQGDRASTVFCRWDESAPRIETFNG
ncbi:hypothetical protein [Streptomyces sp. HNM0574]|uniref:hypothetical protein n=1 Tax=Streptomyces sp. HNM0574 TaxID=2714954 RepID=UPI00146DD218|nr:hypothetical protein [Streptomyces sp. HNM0574]NLU66481.1 hypothetical protein [Streptomyces sp. HNM0574]